MSHQTDLNKPSQYLVHWQCSPRDWQRFGKVRWAVSWIASLVGILSCSYLSQIL